MSSFAAALSQDSHSPNMSVTANGMPTLASSGSDVLNFFFIAGSSRKIDISSQFLKALAEDPVLTLKTLFWARDVRGGAGERATFRSLMRVLEDTRPDLAMRLIPLIPEYGRYDDLMVFQKPETQSVAVDTFVQGVQSGNGLACKWSPRKGPWANLLRKRMGLDPKAYRRLIVDGTRVVETQMCARDWSSINYEHVPSVAGARYQKSFGRHDPVRYAEFKAAALKGTVKVNASALYPYDVIKSVNWGDPSMALAQWNALPNYLNHKRILPMVDVSGSMSSPVGGNKNLSCMDVAVSLGLYIADKQAGSFQDMFLTFHENSKILRLQGNLLEKLKQLQHSQWGMNTNLESAFKEILRVAILGGVPAHEMPDCLLICSDMGFDEGTRSNQRAFDMAREMFERQGYKLPTVVWWDLAHKRGGYGGDNNFPVSQHESGTCLISGFSPSILKSVLAGDDITPYSVMLETLELPRYDAVAEAIGQ